MKMKAYWIVGALALSLFAGTPMTAYAQTGDARDKVVSSIELEDADIRDAPSTCSRTSTPTTRCRPTCSARSRPR